MFSAIEGTQICASEYVSILMSSYSLFPLSNLSKWLLSPDSRKNKPGFPTFLSYSEWASSPSDPIHRASMISLYTIHSYICAPASSSLTLVASEIRDAIGGVVHFSGDHRWDVKPSWPCPGSQHVICSRLKAVWHLRWDALEAAINTKKYWKFFSNPVPQWRSLSVPSPMGLHSQVAEATFFTIQRGAASCVSHR